MPPAAVTTLNGQDGVLVYYIPTSFDLASMPQGERLQAFAQVSAKELSDLSVVHFLLGQSDRHFGNILLDDQFRLILTDNEFIGLLTQFNLNGTSYIKRATLKPELRDHEDEYYDRPFPFGRVRYLNVANPEVAKRFIKNTDIGPRKLTFFAQPFMDQGEMLPIVFWRNMFWTPTRANSLPPLKFDVLSVATLVKLRAMNYENVRAYFPEPHFTNLHRELILKRRDQILELSKTAHLID